MLLIITFILLLILGIFAYRLSKRKKYPDRKDKLLEFELQIFPQGLKISLIPGQPLLIIEKCNSKEEMILSLYKEENPIIYQKLYNSINYMIWRYKIISILPYNAEKCFAEEFTNQNSTHIKIVYENGYYFKFAFFRACIPIEGMQFIESCKDLVQKTFDDVPHLIHTKEEEETKLLERVIIKTVN